MGRIVSILEPPAVLLAPEQEQERTKEEDSQQLMAVQLKALSRWEGAEKEEEEKEKEAAGK